MLLSLASGYRVNPLLIETVFEYVGQYGNKILDNKLDNNIERITVL